MSAEEAKLNLSEDTRVGLRAIGDRMIPASGEMPSASEVGVGDGQLDRVLRARPDLAEPVARAVDLYDPEADLTEGLAAIAAADGEAHEALLLVVAGGYYTDSEVRKRIGYDGQEPFEVHPEIIPPYVEEGLVDGMLERGPIWRPVPAEAAGEPS